MRKTLLLTALLAGTVSFAQNVIIDRPADNQTGLIATRGDDGVGVYTADYFELSSETGLGEVTFFGFVDKIPPLQPHVEAFNIFIFANDNGMPLGNPDNSQSAILSLENIAPSNFSLVEETGNATFTVGITQANGGDQVVLPAGVYWISAFPSVIGGADGDGRWNWFGSYSNSPQIPPVLIDPTDFFGIGATNWSNIEGLIGQSFPGFAWSMTDEAILGAQENSVDSVSVFPNPTTDVLNVKFPASVSLLDIALFTLQGQRIDVPHSNGVLDVSGLANGVYVVRATTATGVYVEKIVKQ